jgi:hypothetical protein
MPADIEGAIAHVVAIPAPELLGKVELAVLMARLAPTSPHAPRVLFEAMLALCRVVGRRRLSGPGDGGAAVSAPSRRRFLAAGAGLLAGGAAVADAATSATSRAPSSTPFASARSGCPSRSSNRCCRVRSTNSNRR